MTILIVDAQGGGLGRALAEKLTAAKLDAELVGVGTNAAATAALRKGGLSSTATGENAVLYNSGRADIITGGIGIICANAMMGEISPQIAAAISGSGAVKVLIPMNRCGIRISGAENLPLAAMLDAALREIREILSSEG